MFVRVVRFTGVTAASMEALIARVGDAGGPPPGVRSSGIEIAFDEAQGTAVVTQRYATATDMEEAARIFDAMDAGDTPGTRVSVDACEVRLALEA